MTPVKGPVCVVPPECPKCGSLNTRVYKNKGLQSWAECNGRLYKQSLQYRKCVDCDEGFKITVIRKNHSRAKPVSGH